MAEPTYSGEEWRDIPGIEGYEVSNLGRVRTKPKILSQYLNPSTGYYTIRLGKSPQQFNGPTHQLVCRAFQGEKPSDKHLVAHWDGDRLNNKADNLRWATHSENLADALRHGTSPLIQYRSKSHSRSKHPMARLSEADVASIKARYAAGERRDELAKEYGVSTTHIWRVGSGKNWK